MGALLSCHHMFRQAFEVVLLPAQHAQQARACRLGFAEAHGVSHDGNCSSVERNVPYCRLTLARLKWRCQRFGAANVHM